MGAEFNSRSRKFTRCRRRHGSRVKMANWPTVPPNPPAIPANCQPNPSVSGLGQCRGSECLRPLANFRAQNQIACAGTGDQSGRDADVSLLLPQKLLSPIAETCEHMRMS